MKNSAASAQKIRCNWAEKSELERVYHDEEWGKLVKDDAKFFELILLEGFQAGLSWRTILAKREAFRAAFCGFDFRRVALFGPADVDRLLQDSGIVRHRGKIEAVIHNAGCACRLVEEAGSLARFIWQFAPPRQETPQSRATSPESVRLSKALKARGWKFVGPTTMFAFMQSMGLVNDHLEGCVTRARVEAALQGFRRP